MTALISGASGLGLSWRSRTALPGPRAALIAFCVDGRVLAAGGTYWKDNRKIWDTRADFFEPATDTWSPGPPLPEPRADSAVARVGGEVLLLGGTSSGSVLSDVLAFSGGAWKPKPDMRLPGPRSYSHAAVHDDKIFLFGGMERAGEIASLRRDVWVWDTRARSKQWRHVSDIPEPARSNYAFASSGGQAYLFGGVSPEGSSFRNLDESWRYDLEANRWEALPGVPQATRAWSAIAHDGRIFLLGGYTDRFVTCILSYSVGANSFVHAGYLPRGLADAAFVSLGSKLYVFGGESGVKIRSGETWEGQLQ